jgi:two-component system response regulator NreC
MTLTILLADDHIVVRQGLRVLLEGQPDFSVVGEASDGNEAIRLVDQLKPQIVILDLVMPGLNGLEVARQIHERTRVIVLSMHANQAYVLEALRNGAYGYVLKDASSNELIHAVRAVGEGRRYLSAPFSENAIQAYLQKTGSAPTDPYDTLTNREREVLHLVAEGFSSAEIAGKLSISVRTVEIHRSNLMHKLDLRSQVDLIRYALRKGILPMA